ncbi:MAG: sugar transferase [Chloroflexota bacterium]
MRKNGRSGPQIPISIRLYKHLLKLYPRPFRTLFANDMVQVFQDTYRDQTDRWGWAGLVWLWGWAFIDLGRSAFPEHITTYFGGYLMQIQRMFDVTFSIIVLLLCWPVWLLVGLGTLLDSGRPIFFQQRRLGLAGHTFNLLKFRTMTNDDQRTITRFGGFLRKTGLDELPQLLNVIRGDMALVGPRPALQHEVDLNSAHWQQILQIRPGITGPWQISGTGSPTSKERIDADLKYLKQQNWRFNLHILARTFQSLFGGRG